MAQHILEIDMNKSAYVDQLRPTDNFGTGEYLRSGERENNIPRYLAALGWDVSLLPVHKKITKAQVWIWEEDKTGTAQNLQLGYNIIPANWDETTLTWNNKPFSASVFKYRVSIFGSKRQGYIAYDIDPADIYTPYGIVLAVIGGIAVIFNSTRAYTNTPYLRIIYEDVPPDPPTPLEPINRFVNNQKVVRFSWQYNSSVGGNQKSFELQWSTDQVNWTTISEETPNTYYDMPAETLPSGNIYWRVRCFNEYGEASLFSDIVTFIAAGPPPTPVVQVLSTNTARPTVSWTAFEQQVYQVQILSGETVIYDSGEKPGMTIQQHKIPIWLSDGQYIARVRVKNEYDIWSEWGAVPFAVTTAKPGKPSFGLQTTAHGIELYIQGTAAYFLIYRAESQNEYACIAKVMDNYFYDCSVKNGTEYQYFVRAVSGNETYRDSDMRLAQTKIRYALLAPVSNLTEIFEFRRSLNSPPERNYTRTLGGSTAEFEGRKYPVWIPSGHANAGLSLKFFLHSWGAVEKFQELYDKSETVLYRDSRGRKIYGVLSSLAVEEQREGYIVSFVITQTDYDEEVEV